MTQDQEECQLYKEKAEFVFNQLAAMQHQARKERAALIKKNLNPNQIAKKAQLSIEDKNLIYKLVRPMMLDLPMKFVIRSLHCNNHDFISKIDVVTLESLLWMMFNGRIENYVPNFVSRKKKVLFTTYLYVCLKKSYIGKIKESAKNTCIISKSSKINITINNFGLYNIPSKQEQIQFYEQENEDMLLILDAIKKNLNSKEYYVLYHRVVEQRTLKSIGDEINLSKDRIRQIQATATRKAADVLKKCKKN